MGAHDALIAQEALVTVPFTLEADTQEAVWAVVINTEADTHDALATELGVGVGGAHDADLA